jgi:hypothetical protein
MDDGFRTAYRKKIGDHVWHWCRTCPTWPSYSDSIESLQAPTKEERCPDCLAIERAHEYCEPNPA